MMDLKIITCCVTNLKKLNIPYTIYITTKFVNDNLMSWIDNIDYAIDKQKRLKLELDKTFPIVSRQEKILS